jgi:hypothetical protein
MILQMPDVMEIAMKQLYTNKNYVKCIMVNKCKIQNEK